MSDPPPSTVSMSARAPSRRPNGRRGRPPRSSGSHLSSGRSGWRPRRAGPRPRGRGFLPLALVAAFLVLLLGGTGFGSGVAFGVNKATVPDAPPAGAPTLSGYYIVGYGDALVAVGYIGWVGTWTLAGNGSSVYGNTFYLVFFDVHGYPVNVTVDVNQNSGWVENTSVFCPAFAQTAITLSLPENPKWLATTFYFDGVPYWTGRVATPISLLPNYILDLGGLDFFGLTVVSFMVINGAAGFALAKRVMKTAVFAPRFSLLIWGHVCIAIIVGAVFLNYQLIDSTFAGWSPLVYPFFTFPMFFLTGLSYFNKASAVEALGGTPMGDDGMGFTRVVVRIGRVAGQLYAVGEGWGDFFARWRKHYGKPFNPADETKPSPLLIPVTTLISPTVGPRERMKLERRAKRRSSGPTELISKFPVLGAQPDDIEYIAFIKNPTTMRIPLPYLSFTRKRKVGKRAAKDPTTGERTYREVEVTRPAFPHYVDPTTGPDIEFEDQHFKWGLAVWSFWVQPRDLSRVVSKLRTRIAALETYIESRLDDELYSILKTEKTLRERAVSGLTDEETRAVGAASDALTRSEPGGGSP